MPYNIGKISQLIEKSLSNLEIKKVCTDKFPEISDDIRTEGLFKSQRIDKLISHVDKNEERIEKLLNEVKKLNPEKYKQYEPFEEDRPKQPPGQRWYENPIYLVVALFSILFIIILGINYLPLTGTKGDDNSNKETSNTNETASPTQRASIKEIVVEVTTYAGDDNYYDKNKKEGISFTIIGKDDLTISSRPKGFIGKGEQWTSGMPQEPIILSLDHPFPFDQCNDIKVKIEKEIYDDRPHNWHAKIAMYAKDTNNDKVDLEITNSNSKLIWKSQNGPKLHTFQLLSCE